MNKSVIFKKAHKLTKEILQKGDNYRVTFGACLKFLIEEEKSTVSQQLTAETLEKVLAEKVPTVSFSIWRDRVYINFSDADRSYRGDNHTKVWFKETKESFYLKIESVRGVRTSKMNENLEIISETLLSLGFQKENGYSSFEDGYIYKI